MKLISGHIFGQFHTLQKRVAHIYISQRVEMIQLDAWISYLEIRIYSNTKLKKNIVNRLNIYLCQINPHISRDFCKTPKIPCHSCIPMSVSCLLSPHRVIFSILRLIHFFYVFFQLCVIETQSQFRICITVIDKMYIFHNSQSPMIKGK